LPTHFLTDLLPHLILLIQLLTGFEELEARQKIVHFEELAELVKHVGVGQEIGAAAGTVFDEGGLDLLEHELEFLLLFLTEDQHSHLLVDTVLDLLHMVIHLR
jgi:hypothetical protein